ncbi:ferrochelatase, partial [Sphingobium sp.]|uniref:ferrochelatase n=1 Tax=Sphingobium sp. TaxID=1912891 RepID=UPI002D1D0FAF
KNIAVATPGFAADCLETLEEIALRAKDVFLSRGGENFAYLSCLNASPEAITLYKRLMSRELSGWMD